MAQYYPALPANASTVSSSPLHLGEQQQQQQQHLQQQPRGQLATLKLQDGTTRLVYTQELPHEVQEKIGGEFKLFK